MGCKIVCAGGGSLYFASAVPDLLVASELSGSEIVVYDIDLPRAELMAAMGARLAAEAGTGCTVRATADPEEALDSARFVLASIGGSGAGVSADVYGSSYHAADMWIPARYGIQQVVGDTAGPAGMMMALRAVPVYVDLCRRMERRCPDAILLNHSNPMAVLCRAMRKYTGISVIGICHGVQGGIGYAAGLLGVPAEELECLWIGTNHYYWFTRVLHRGRDVYPELRRRVAEAAPDPGRIMSAKLSEIYGHQIVYPEDDHIIEFYPFATQVHAQDDLPYGLAEKARAHGFDARGAMPSRQDRPAASHEEFLADFARRLDAVMLPAASSDGRTGEGIAAMIGAIATGRRTVCIANLDNRGAIPNLPPTAEVEIEAVTDSRGVRGLHMGEAPLALKGLLEKRFVWHELVADAAVLGDRNLALQAMLVDEMALPPEKSEAMLDELLNASRALLPQFFG